MGREEWVHKAYRQLRKAAALAPQAIVLSCKLSLLMLVVDVVWFGVINQGVRSAVPGVVRAEALARFEEGMSARDVALVESSFSAPNASGIRHFDGNPAQLQPLSRLSRVFARTASQEDGGLRAGISRVHDEYETLGISKAVTRSSYLAQAIRDASSWFALLLVVKNWQYIVHHLHHFAISCLS